MNIPVTLRTTGTETKRLTRAQFLNVDIAGPAIQNELPENPVLQAAVDSWTKAGYPENCVVDVSVSAGPARNLDAKRRAPAAFVKPTTIPQAVAMLNKSDPAHWTKAGAPDLTVLGEYLGHRVTRKEVTDALA